MSEPHSARNQALARAGRSRRRMRTASGFVRIPWQCTNGFGHTLSAQDRLRTPGELMSGLDRYSCQVVVRATPKRNSMCEGTGAVV